MADLAALQKTLGLQFKDPSLLEQALVHSSYVNENPELGAFSNERLEFLGDAVLGLVVAEKLYQDSPDFTEGEMTRFRAALVREETLARIASGLRLGEHLCLGKGEEKSGGRRKPRNLARVLEALIGAVFLDRDGVINELIYYREHGIVDSPFAPEQFNLLAGVSEAINELHIMGYKVIVTSNQPGVAKEHFSNQVYEYCKVH